MSGVTHSAKGYWTVITSNTQLKANNGYIIGTASNLTLTLPVSTSVGDEIEIQGRDGGIFTVVQNANQTTYHDGEITTTGAGNGIRSTGTHDYCVIRTVINNTDFVTGPFIGNIAIYAPAPPVTAHYKLNDNAASGVITDSLGHFPATLAAHNTSEVSTVAKISRGIQFDGNDDDMYIRSNSTFTMDFDTTSYSIAFWAYDPQDLTSKTFCQVGNSGSQFLLFYHNVDSGTAGSWGGNENDVMFFFSGLGAAFATRPAPNTWAHYVGIWDASVKHLKLYKNGVLAQNADLSATSPTVQTLSRIWVGTQGGSNTTDALMDDFRLYDHALTAPEIAAIYNSGSGSEVEI